jgi:hypothetical protein
MPGIKLFLAGNTSAFGGRRVFLDQERKVPRNPKIV